MYGHIILAGDAPGRRALLERETPCGLPVLRATVPAPENLREKRLERRVYRAALRLWDAGVSRVLLLPDFPWRAALKRAGLAGVETAPLCRAAAAPLTMTALTLRGWQPGRAVVAMAGERVSPELLHAAETLALQVCRLVVEVPAGGRELADYLHGEYGLPVLPPGVVRPALTVAFDESGQGSGVTLRLWGEQPELLGAQVWLPGVEPPPGYPPMPFLAALRESGLTADRALRARPLGKSP